MSRAEGQRGGHTEESLETDVHAHVCAASRFSRVGLLATPWAAAPQAPQSMGFSEQEDWTGLPLPPPGDLPDPGTELRSPALQAGSLPLSHLGSICMYIPHLIPERIYSGCCSKLWVILSTQLSVIEGF